jgi:DNA-directed RNA polymerase beta' subunit
MDIQHLVDRLEDLIDEGRHMPFSKYTMIDEERALELIDQMRISIPEEIEKASRVLATRDRIMAQANEEAARVVQMARKKSDELLDQEVSVQAAHNRAANIIEQARQEAENIIAEADKYVLDELTKLEQHLIKTLTVVRNGISEVVNNQANAPIRPAETTQNEAIGIPTPPPQRDMPYITRQPVEVDASAGKDHS